MFIRCISTFLSLCAGAVLAKPLRLLNEDTLNPATPTVIDAAFASNHTSSSNALDVAVEEAFHIECNGALYGFYPNIADCENAAASVIPDGEPIIWGERHTGIPGDFFPLPFGVFGDRAECVVRTVIPGDSPTARASLRQVKSAAAALSLRCAASGESQGGIATNIGGDNNLAVILSKYEPNIRCGNHATFDDPTACGSIMGEMPASRWKTRFGPDGVPGVQEPLPQVLVSSDTSCLLRLYSTGRADNASWYSIWEAAEATFARCARDRKSGSFTGLGDNGDILLTLTALPPHSPGNVSLVAIS